MVRKSRWVGVEVRTALSRSVKDPSFRVVPVLADGAGPEDLPAFLGQYHALDLSRGVDAEVARFAESLAVPTGERLSRPLLAEGEPPYRGLLAFHPEHAHLFFGRDREVGELLKAPQRDGFLAVVGDSGSGKSSLVRAGLVPALHGGRFEGGASWRVAVPRPGDDPFGELAKALPNLDVALSAKDHAEFIDAAREKLPQGPERLGNRIAALVIHQTYDDIGRLRGALARHANEVYEQFGKPQQEVARRIFVDLVQSGEASGDTRRRVKKSTILSRGGDPVATESVLAQLAAKRLVTTGHDKEEIVELAHEVLVRERGRLREWLADDREFLLWRRRLRDRIHEWEELGRDEATLLRGRPLADAQDQEAERGEELDTKEREFLLLSRVLEDRRRQEAEKRQQELDAARLREQEALSKEAESIRQQAKQAKILVRVQGLRGKGHGRPGIGRRQWKFQLPSVALFTGRFETGRGRQAIAYVHGQAAAVQGLPRSLSGTLTVTEYTRRCPECSV